MAHKAFYLLCILAASSSCTPQPNPSVPEDAFRLMLPDFGSLDFGPRDSGIDQAVSRPDMGLPQQDMAPDARSQLDAQMADMLIVDDGTPPDAMPLDAMPPDAMPLDAMPLDFGIQPDAQAIDAGVVDQHPTDAAAPACELVDERCDSLDNDCDNLIDEGFEPGAACEVGVPGCLLPGQWMCAADGARICIPDQIPAERCDDFDNDCDGWVDEGFGIGAPCAQGIGICARTATWACNLDEEAECVVDPGEAEPREPEPNEACDRLDNDCDGMVDEGREGVACNDAPPSCGDARGVIVCRRNGASCQPDPERPQPRFEACNGMDDDCDGHIDEGVATRFGPSLNRALRVHYDPESATFGDVDADGDLDVIGLSSVGPTLFWRENRNGALEDSRVIGVQPRGVNLMQGTVLVAADFDADGDADLIAGGQFFLNTHGVFHPPRALDFPDQLRWAAAADLDGDARPDLVYELWEGVFWRRSMGAGRFDAAEPLFDLNQGRGNPRPRIALHDLNGDGLLDVFACCQGRGFAGAPLWRMNLGGGVFSDPINPLDRADVRSAIPGDLDGDGDVDLVYHARGATRVALNDGSGAFCPVDASLDQTLVDVLDLDMNGRSLIVTPDDLFRFDGAWQRVARLWRIARERSLVADINQDGRGDILPPTGGTLALSQPGAAYAYAFDLSRPSTHLDIDRDGRKDQVDLRNTWRRSLGRAGYGPAHRLGDHYLGVTAAVDMDGDGIDDLLYCCAPSARGDTDWMWRKVFAQGGLSEPIDPQIRLSADPARGVDLDGQGGTDLIIGSQIIFNAIRGPRRMESYGVNTAVADIDQDGDLDVVVHADTDAGDTGLFWLSNNGRGGFGNPNLIAIVDDIFRLGGGVLIGDLDGDGDPDIVSPANRAAFINNGRGGMTVVDLPPETNGARVRVLDVDADGRAEYVRGTTVFSLLADGEFDAGRYLEHNVIHVGSSGFLDFDADGDIDILMRHYWIENRGRDGYGSTSRLATLPQTPGFVGPDEFVPADFDGDGRVDLVYAEPRQLPEVDSGVYWFQQAENRLFKQQAMLVDGIATPVAVAVHDVDADGDQDLLVISAQDDAIYVLHAQAQGFENPVRLGAANGSNRLRLVDVDGDGRLDLVRWGGLQVAYFRGQAAGFDANALNIGDFGLDPTRKFSFVDLNGDGRLDFLGLIPRGLALHWRQQAEDGRFGERRFIGGRHANGVPVRAESFQHFDVDGDGDQDLLVANLGLYWFVNDGAGEFELAGEIASDALVSGVHTAVDDVLVLSVQLGEGMMQARLVNGELTEPTLIGPGLWNPKPIDMDGDGQIDLAFDLGVVWGAQACEVEEE